ncbi:MAG: mannose-1-phosphate guanylyltransferase [Bacteroidaceae bacterium]|nr:mannose-1-phosphate guanylyltransferase [Bacteroidaceae bacterium]
MLGSDNFCVVLAGGFGTRLWPLSRKGMPKQFLDFNNNGHTLLKETVERMKRIFPEENIIVSTNLDFYEDVCTQLPDLNPLQVLREPVMKGTAPSITLASYHIRDINPNANILVVPSDLVIKDEKPYIDVIEKGMSFVSENSCILTVGIKPTRPETRFGYIQIDEKKAEGIYSVRTFTEKPEESFAKVFVDSGEFYWNSGILMWNVNAYIDIAKTHLPDMISQFNRIYDTKHNRDERRSLLYSVYEAFPHISIDYGILEKTDKVCMAIGDFSWNDIESWDLLYDYCAKDGNGNVLGMYNYQVYNCNNSMFLCNKEKKLVVIDDLSEFLVVDTDDVLVICRRNNETDFKKYINDAMLKYGEKYS